MPDVNDVLPIALYKKLQNQLKPIVEKLNHLEHATNIIESKEGPRGATGNRGVAGESGAQGIQGEKGQTGSQGERGESGLEGQTGAQGERGLEGQTGSQGEQGIQGERGLEGQTGSQGERGEQGIQGEIGQTGAQGEQGIQGEIGQTGAQGERGEQGIQGEIGLEGQTGAQGERGEQGIQGEIGLEGQTGAQGERGLEGQTGAQGERGEQGIQGEIGSDGPAGKDAIIPDISNIIEPFITKSQTHIDVYIDKSEKAFKSWQNIVNNQLSTIGGGGEVWLRHLNDVDRTTTRVDGAYLKYNAATKKWVGVTNSITLTGDVTGSGIGSFATTIATGAVSLAKMANVASSTVFYRKTGGAGAPEVQSLSTLKTDLGLSGTNTGDQDLSGLVPYSGATGAVNLGSQSLTAGTITSNGNTVATVVDPVRTTLTGDGVLSTFAISGASGLVNPAALIVAIDGAMQEPVVDYTVASGQITFTSPLANAAKAVVISPTNTLQVSQMIPADGSVSSSKLANDLTLTNAIINGTANFAGTTRPTSAGTGVPAATSLITRADADARSVSTILGTNFVVNNSATRADTTMVLSLGVGTWELNGYFETLNAATGGAKIYIAVAGAQPESYQHRLTMISVSGGGANPIFGSSVPEYGAGTSPFVFSRSLASGASSNFQLLPSVIVLTASATFTIGFSQNTAVASNTTLYSFSKFWANRISH